MSSINPQIDAAVALMKARAAEFDETKTLDGYTVGMAFNDATKNLRSAQARWDWGRATLSDEERHRLWRDARCDLLDTMNLCALTLSMLPKGGE